MRIAIVANGEIGDCGAVAAKLVLMDYVIACDGGLCHMEKMGLFPDVIIGDLDSAPRDFLELCRRKGILVQKYPTEKDETDLALAVSFALEKGAESVVIFGGLGGRIDHAVANLHVLVMAGEIPAEIWDAKTSVQLVGEGVRQSLSIGKEHYETVTLMPLSSQATGIRTSGLAYPLNGDTLQMGIVRGVSNCFTPAATHAEISVESGILLVIRAA
jgi:thiamine pyrophosphokinase